MAVLQIFNPVMYIRPFDEVPQASDVPLIFSFRSYSFYEWKFARLYPFSHWPAGNHQSTSCSISLISFRSTYKWDRSVFVFFLSYLTSKVPSRFIYVVINGRIFLPFNAWIISHYNVCVSHFFIHSPIGRHLGCLCVFAIVNNAAVNMWVQISIWACDFIFLDMNL